MQNPQKRHPSKQHTTVHNTYTQHTKATKNEIQQLNCHQKNGSLPLTNLPTEAIDEWL